MNLDFLFLLLYCLSFYFFLLNSLSFFSLFWIFSFLILTTGDVWVYYIFVWPLFCDVWARLPWYYHIIVDQQSWLCVLVGAGYVLTCACAHHPAFTCDHCLVACYRRWCHWTASCLICSRLEVLLESEAPLFVLFLSHTHHTYLSTAIIFWQLWQRLVRMTWLWGAAGEARDFDMRLLFLMLWLIYNYIIWWWPFPYYNDIMS